MTETTVTTTTGTITAGFRDLLKAIGWMQEDLMSVCTDAVSENHPDGDFRARVMPAARAVEQVASSAAAKAGNTWFGVAPIRADFLTSGGRGRGGARDIRAVRALYADLDIKPGGLGSYEDAKAIIEEISADLGTWPVAVVSTGGGLQPYWRVSADGDSEFTPGSDQWLAAVALLRRFGRLVATVAERYDAKVDSVYNLDRILRVPGTDNRKYDPPVQAGVELYFDAAGGIALAELGRVLDEAGIAETDEDTAVLGEIVAPVEGWSWAPDGVECQYVRAMVESWAGEKVDGGARHTWLVAQATRLAAVHRAGLVTEKQYQGALSALLSRFHALVEGTEPKRSAGPGEIAGALGWGQIAAASKTDAGLTSEFGGHRHEIDGGVFGEGSACLRGMSENGAVGGEVESIDTWTPSAPSSTNGNGARAAAVESSGMTTSERGEQDGPRRDEVESIPEDSTEDEALERYQMQPAEMFTDARMAELAVRDVLDGQFVWVKGLGWLRWSGKVWRGCSDQAVLEAVRSWARRCLADIVVKKKRGPGDPYYDGWQKMLGKLKLGYVVGFAMGIVECEAAGLDRNPDLLNTPSGIVDLRTGEVRQHDSRELMTKITSGSYKAGYKHPDWEQALGAIAVDDGDTLRWFQARIGQGVTGHRSPDGVNVVMQGGGQNGKGVLISDGLVPAFGDYAELASHKLILGSENEHSEEMASLQGKRLLVAEELTEGRALNIGAIKRISDISTITARHVYQRNMSFPATHTLVATTNYIPVVNETDWGSWRRLAMLCFPFTYVESAEMATKETDRVGDTRLKRRIEQGLGGQHDAAVTWAVEGAIRWYQRGSDALVASAWVVAKTEAWRGNADRISSFWNEILWRDDDSCVLGVELFEAFNEWLIGNGHKAWGREMFESRFESHQVTLRNGVEKRRTRSPKGVSRHIRSDDWKPAALDGQAQHRVWLGVRFASSDDHRVLRSVPSLPKTP